MSAVDSSSTRNPIDTISSVPPPAACRERVAGRILPSSPVSRPSTPSMRGTLKPQMSASRMPTRRPRAASAAARLTVTGALADATLATRDREDTRRRGDLGVGVARGAFQRAALHRGRPLLLGHLDQRTFTSVTPGRPRDLRLDFLLISACSGQPRW